jgi:hypothetical protein
MKGREKQVDVAGENRVKEGKHKVSTRSYMALSQELQRTFHQVTLEDRKQVSSQKPRRGSLWPTERGNVTRHC